MQRVALVVVPLVLLVGCRERNDQFCDNDANQSLEVCGGMIPDGPPIDVSCKADDGCTANPDQPVCKITGNTGVCVECTPEKRMKCPTMKPICTNDRCAPCTRHSDCTESNVCKPDGSCALETEVAYVDGAGADQMICSKMEPCTKIEKAAMTGRIVKVSGTVSDPTVLNNRNPLILADPGAKLSPSMDAVALEIRGNSQVEIYDLEISHTGGASREGITIADTADLRLTRVSLVNNNADGARVTGGKLTCTRCTITQNAVAGINAAGSSNQPVVITISQSTIANNVGGGIQIGLFTSFQIVGNVIFHNGASATFSGGINAPQVTASSTNRIDFNSISRNESASAPGISCTVTAQFTGRYNIIWDNGTPPIYSDQVNSGVNSCDHTFSNIGPLPATFGTNNKNTDPGFMDENNGNLHLRQSDPQLTVTPSSNELTGLAARDIDDQPRAATTDMGADHVPRTP